MNTMTPWVPFPSFPLLGDIIIVPLCRHVEYECGQVVFDLEERSEGCPAMLLPSKYLVHFLVANV